MSKRIISLCLTLIISLLCSCYTIYNKKYYEKTNHNRHLFLSYISEKPIIIDIATLDTNYISIIKYKIERNPEHYQIIELKVKPVDFFMSNDSYKFMLYSNKETNSTPASESVFLQRFKTVYLLCKKGEYLKKTIKEYKNKKLILIDEAHYFTKSDSTTVMYSFEVFFLNNSMKFNHLINIP